MPTRIKDGQLVADPTAEQAHDAADTTIQRVQDLMTQLEMFEMLLAAQRQAGDELVAPSVNSRNNSSTPPPPPPSVISRLPVMDSP